MNRDRPHRPVAGVTLIELLIASVIGVIMVFTIVVLLRQTMRTSLSTKQSHRVTEVAQQLLDTLVTPLSEAPHLMTAKAHTITVITPLGDPLTFQWENQQLLRNGRLVGDPAVEVTQLQFSYFRAETPEEIGSPTSQEGLVEEPLGADPDSQLSPQQRARIRLIKIRLSLRQGTLRQELATAAARRLA